MKTTLFVATLFSIFGIAAANADDHKHDNMHAEHAAANVYIQSPADGATVSNPVTVKFGLEGMMLSPAGMGGMNSGHHHLIVDGKLPAFDQPMGGNVMHFGKAQTETQLTLSPGKHTLQLIMGDKMHMPHKQPVYSQAITITVK